MTRSFILNLLCPMMWALAVAGCAGKSVRTENDSGKSFVSPQARELIRKDPNVYTQADLEEARENARKATKNTAALAEYHFSLAQAYSADGKVDQAIEEYRLTLIFDPNSALVHTRLAAEYIKKGMLSAAMESCKEAIRLEPKFIDARLILAGLYSTIQDQTAALKEYTAILKLDPKHEEAAIFKAQVLVEEGQMDRAIAFLKKFLKTTPDSPGTWYYIGRTYQLLDKFKESEKAYLKALKLHSSFYQAAHALAFLYETKGKNKKALEIYQNLYEERQDRGAANRIATIYLKEEKYKLAIPYLEALKAMDPDDLNARVKLGLTWMELKNFEKAIQVFNEILAKNPTSDRIHYYLGSVYEQKKDYPKAIEHLKKVSPASRLFENSALHVTFLLKQVGRKDEAVAYMSSAIEAAPKVPSFYIFLASLREDEKNINRAVDVLEAAVKQFPQHEKIRYYLGSLYDKQGDIEKSLKQMETLLVQNPENPDALNYIGYTWTVQGVRLDKAEQMIRKAMKLRPNNGYIVDSLGWNQFVRGKYHDAVILLEKAVRLTPDEATIMDHLGDAYLKANFREKALLQYEKAILFATEAMKIKIAEKIENLRKDIAGRTGETPKKDREPAAAQKNK